MIKERDHDLLGERRERETSNLSRTDFHGRDGYFELDKSWDVWK